MATPYCLFGQAAPFKFLPISVNEGLSQNSVWCMFTDSRGWLWAGTSGGLNLKKGASITVFKQAKSDSTTIQGNNINFIFEDKLGNVWIGNDGGIDVFDPIKEVFYQAYSFGYASPSGQRVFYYLTEPGADYVWIGINNKAVYRFNVAKKSIDKELNAIFPQPYAFRQLLWSSVQNNKKAYLYFDDGQFLIWDFITSSFYVKKLGLPFGSALHLYQDTCYLYSQGVIYAWNGNGFERKINAPGLRICRSITHWGKYLVFAGEDGYIFYDPKQGRQQYFGSLVKEKNRSYTRIVSLHTNKQGILYMGTDGSGIFYHTPFQDRFTTVQNPTDELNMVKGMVVDGNNTLLYLAYGRGLLRYNLKSNEWKLFESSSSFPLLKSKTFSALCLSKLKNHVWISHTVSNGVCGLFRVNYVSGEGRNYSNLVVPILGKQNASSYNSYLDTFNGKVYLISNSSLIEIEESGNEATAKVVFSDTTKALSCFTFGNQGKHLVIGHSEGALVIAPHTKQQPLVLKEIGRDLVKCIIQHSNGNFYLATTGGLFVYDKYFRFINQYTMRNGLSDNFVYGVMEDQFGAIWLSHNKGLNRFDPIKSSFQHFSVNDGLQSNEFNTNAFTKAQNGWLFFGGVNGINYFDPKQIYNTPIMIGSFVNRLFLFDEPIKVDSALYIKRHLQFPYHINTLSFEFGHNDLMNPEAVSFIYQLKGIDRDWIDSKGREMVRYPNLNPGNYQLLLKAVDGNGNLASQGYTLQITINKPYWQTWWFRLMVAFVILGLCFVLVRGLVKRNQVKLMREIQVQSRLEKERLRISRDLHDNVGAQLSYLITNLDWMIRHPQTIQTEEELSRLKDLSETGKQAILTLRQTIWALHNQEIGVIEFADKFKQFAMKMLAFSSQTKISFEEEFLTHNILAPELALGLFRICQEALANAIKHAKATEILVCFSSNSKSTFYFQLMDNGVGFSSAHSLHEGHYGLENMKTRAEECGALFMVESEAGKGTKITVSIK